ncbi:MAG TPA: hypothetical protein VKV73_02885 [Chloroflexota bacterium]|nr:hypothetical protein [Chloroflexota bacterium]
MSAPNDSTRPQQESELHEIRVQGHLDQRWADWLEGMTVTHERDGTTTLAGALVDQAALHGVLNRIRDLALPIVSVLRTRPDGQRAIR